MWYLVDVHDSHKNENVLNPNHTWIPSCGYNHELQHVASNIKRVKKPWRNNNYGKRLFSWINLYKRYKNNSLIDYENIPVAQYNMRIIRMDLILKIIATTTMTGCGRFWLGNSELLHFSGLLRTTVLCRDIWINTVIQLVSRGINVRARETLITRAAHYIRSSNNSSRIPPLPAEGRRQNELRTSIFIYFYFLFRPHI